MAFFLYQIAHRGSSSAAISATVPNMRPCRRLSSFFLPVLNSTVLTSVPNEDLSAFNTLGLPSRAEALVRFIDPAQIDELSALAQSYKNVFVLGGGSNVVLGARVSGLVIKVETRGLQMVDDNADEIVVEVQAGENWHGFVSHCVGQAWHGIENLALIPGTVGAAPVQNIGAYGVELDQCFHSLVAWNFRTGRKVELGPGDCEFAYRDSLFKRSEPGSWLILALRLRLSRKWRPVLNYPALRQALPDTGAKPSAQQVFDAVCAVRRSKLPDPEVLGNAGSFFKNPVVDAASYRRIADNEPDLVAYPQSDGTYKLAAGWLIDRAGWKGRRLGPAGVHDRQALVLVNHGGATADDIHRLAMAITTDVFEQFGVKLEQEPVDVR